MAGDSFESRVVRSAVPVIATALVWVLVGAFATSLTAAHEVIADEQPSFAQLPESPSAESVDVTARELGEITYSPLRIRTCSIAADLGERASGELTGAVADSTSGEFMWSLNSAEPVSPASVQKILTATAAWRVLGEDFRFVTTVTADTEGHLWLIGGGDPTLTRSPVNNYYDSESSLVELAQQTVVGVSEGGFPSPHTLHVDTSRYEGFSEWDESWRRGSWALGYVAPVTSLMVDGDRDNPALRLGARSTSPATRAQVWFSEALAQRGMIFDTFEAASPAQGVEVARVESARLPDLLHIMLEDSDNSLAEALAREVALASGTNDVNQALLDAIGVAEEDREGVFLRDGSGLRPLNQLPASIVVRVLREWVNTPQFEPLLAGLPVAGETGSLQRRFSGDSSARGGVRAKTGSIAGVRSLAGVFDDEYGHAIVFALNVSGPGVSDRNRDGLDALTEAIYDCGENLAHWDNSDFLTTE